MRVWVPHRRGLEHMGELPPEVQVEVWNGTGDPPASRDEVEFYVPAFLTEGPAVEIVKELPNLRVVQTLTAGFEAVEPHLPPGVLLCNARGAHDAPTAEWIVGATLATIREFPRFVRAQDAGRWDYGFTDALAGKTVLICGYGSIGQALERRLAGFEVDVVRVARRARDGVHPVSELPELLPQAHVLVVLVPLSEATRHLVDAATLARLPDGAVVVNAARGPVVDTDALVAELRSGRLRAALDVTDPEPLPEGHPLWSAPGVFITPHVAGSTPLAAPRSYRLVGEQIRRWVAGQPLVNVVNAAPEDASGGRG